MRHGFVIWLTGLPGSGKTTIAHALATQLRVNGLRVEVLDSRAVGSRLAQEADLARADRDEDTRLISLVASLLVRNGVVVLVAAVTPRREVRDAARGEIGYFVEVYVKCSLEELGRREFAQASAVRPGGEVRDVGDISRLYEEPLAPEVTVDTGRETVPDSVAKVLRALDRLGYAEIRASGRVLGNDRRHAWQTVPAHGGRLVNRLASADEATYWREESSKLPSVQVSRHQIHFIEMIANGAFSPLVGFLGSSDYESVLQNMRLASGHVWPTPITLAVSPEEARDLPLRRPVRLQDSGGKFLAILHLREKFEANPDLEAASLLHAAGQTQSRGARIRAQGRLRVAGPITLVQRSSSPFPEYRMGPAETRALFAAAGWRRVVGLHTCDLIQRTEEHLLKLSLEIADGVLLQAWADDPGDSRIPTSVRMRCYEALIESHYPGGRVVVTLGRSAVPSADPRQALLQALVHQNYGCTHSVVRCRPDEVGSHCDSLKFQDVFDQFQPGELGVTPLFFEEAYYCRGCEGVASHRTCPHDSGQHFRLGKTQLQEALRTGQEIPRELVRPEVAKILAEVKQWEDDPLATALV